MAVLRRGRAVADHVAEHRGAGGDHRAGEEEEARRAREAGPPDEGGAEPGAAHRREAHGDGARQGDGPGAEVADGADEGGDADDGVAEDDGGLRGQSEDLMQDGLREDRAAAADEAEDEPDAEREEGTQWRHMWVPRDISAWGTS